MSHRILLVDDEDDILEFVRYNLQREGYEVFTARDGAEGVARALEVHPHLILLDRMMPRAWTGSKPAAACASTTN